MARKKTPPPILFKYKSLATKEDMKRIRDIFEKTEIYLPTFDQLNDPFESIIKLHDISTGKTEYVEQKCRILSFSATAFGQTLWGNYADSNKGICIGFRTSSSFADVRCIDYTDGRGSAYGDKEQARRFGLLHFKHTDWKSEKEWRVVQDSEAEKFRRFERSEVACVLLGADIDSMDERYIKHCLDDNGYDSSILFNMAIIAGSFDFIAVNVEDPRKRARSTDELIALTGT